MENNCEFKPFDKVLVRYDNQHEWQIDFFSHYVHGVECPYKCLTRDFNQCIPYEGNEHLLGTRYKPGQCRKNKNTLFGIELKAGYVLMFDDDQVGILFPLKVIGVPKKEKFAIINTRGGWVDFDLVETDRIVAIRGFASGRNITSGEVLWKRPQKQAFTKTEIAEKLGMSEQDFEIVEEENKENE